MRPSLTAHASSAISCASTWRTQASRRRRSRCVTTRSRWNTAMTLWKGKFPSRLLKAAETMPLCSATLSWMTTLRRRKTGRNPGSMIRAGYLARHHLVTRKITMYSPKPSGTLMVVHRMRMTSCWSGTGSTCRSEQSSQPRLMLHSPTTARRISMATSSTASTVVTATAPSTGTAMVPNLWLRNCSTEAVTYLRFTHGTTSTGREDKTASGLTCR